MAENTELTKAGEKKEVAHSNNKVTDYSLGIYNRVTSFHGILCAIHVASCAVRKFCFDILHSQFTTFLFLTFMAISSGVKPFFRNMYIHCGVQPKNFANPDCVYVFPQYEIITFVF